MGTVCPTMSLGHRCSDTKQLRMIMASYNKNVTFLLFKGFCESLAAQGLYWLSVDSASSHWIIIHLIMLVMTSTRQRNVFPNILRKREKKWKCSEMACITYAASYSLHLNKTIVKAVTLREKNPINPLFFNTSKTWFGRTEFPQWSDYVLLVEK